MRTRRLMWYGAVGLWLAGLAVSLVAFGVGNDALGTAAFFVWMGSAVVAVALCDGVVPLLRWALPLLAIAFLSARLGRSVHIPDWLFVALAPAIGVLVARRSSLRGSDY